jgi:hypothetical protein
MDSRLRGNDGKGWEADSPVLSCRLGIAAIRDAGYYWLLSLGRMRWTSNMQKIF